jgi:hypothetical protein
VVSPIQRAVTKIDGTPIFIKTAGLSNKAGIAILKAAGLVPIRMMKWEAMLRIEHDQWCDFIHQEELSQ